MPEEDITQLTAVNEFVQASPYFAGLSPSAIDSIGKLIFEKSVRKGELITHEGDPGEALYFVVSGAVKCFKTSEEGKEQIIKIALPGDSFNDVAVLDDGPNPVSGEAMSPVVLYGITKRDVERILKDNQKVVANVVRILAGRIRHLLELVEDLSFRRVTGRIAKLLLDYAGDSTGPRPRLTQQEMAAAVGTAREVVGRSLKTLQEEGAIRMERNRLVIVDKKTLVQMAHSAA